MNFFLLVVYSDTSLFISFSFLNLASFPVSSNTLNDVLTIRKFKVFLLRVLIIKIL